MTPVTGKELKIIQVGKITVPRENTAGNGSCEVAAEEEATEQRQQCRHHRRRRIRGQRRSGIESGPKIPKQVRRPNVGALPGGADGQLGAPRKEDQRREPAPDADAAAGIRFSSTVLVDSVQRHQRQSAD